MEPKLNFKEAAELINERNQKSIFLFLQIPWLSSVVASISATSQGLVYIVAPKNVNESFLGFIFSNIPNTGGYIIATAVCNLVVDLFFFYILMLFKNKFEINKLRVVALLLTGHLLAISLYFLSSINENANAISMSVTRLFFLASTFYILLRYLPRKYFEILLPYSLIFITHEIQTLRGVRNKFNDDRVSRNSKRRLRLYTRAVLVEHVDDSSETELIGLLRKQEAIDEAKSNENIKVVQDFCNYLNSSFGIRIPKSEIVFEKETPSERRVRKIVSSMDVFLAT